MAKKKISFGSMELLQFITGLALFLIGLFAIVNYNSTGRELARSVNQLFGGKSDTLDLVLGILLAVSGVLVFVTTVVPLEKKALLISCVIALVIWVIRIILVYFTSDIGEPNFLAWAAPLLKDLVVLSALWVVCRKYL